MRFTDALIDGDIAAIHANSQRKSLEEHRVK